MFKENLETISPFKKMRVGRDQEVQSLLYKLQDDIQQLGPKSSCTFIFFLLKETKKTLLPPVPCRQRGRWNFTSVVHDVSFLKESPLWRVRVVFVSRRKHYFQAVLSELGAGSVAQRTNWKMG